MTAGYSGTPLPTKLGIKPGSRVCVVGAPKGFESELQPLPADATLRAALRGKSPFDVIVAFLDDREALQLSLPKLRNKVADRACLWLAWRKRSSGQATDLGEADVRAAGLASGFVDVKVAALTEVWSGLKFVVPLSARTRSGGKSRDPRGLP